MNNNNFVLNFTPTGMIPTKDMTPHVPINPEEIINEVKVAGELGANMVHLHARDADGKPTYKKEIYKNIISGIRQFDKEIILCVSTSGRTYSEFEKRSECLNIENGYKPDFGSLTLSSLNFNKQASVSSPDMIKNLAKKMLNNCIKPELEVFDLGMINYAKYLISKNLIKPPYYFNFILGNIACAQGDLLHLGLLIKELPENSLWAAGGVGDHQFKTNVMALISGGGVRVGLEDNIFFDRNRKKLAKNFDLLKRIVSIADILGYKPYKASELRKILGLNNHV